MTDPRESIPLDILAELDPKRAKFVCARASGKNGKEAALEAGYAPAYAKQAASRLMKNPRIARAVDALRQQGVAEAKYDLVRLIRNFEADREFARSTKNAMAAVKASENIGRLSGFLDHRIEVNVTHVDVAGALADARARVRDYLTGDIETVEFTERDTHS